jgi:(4S)-4-hydroxy-5-phosphonooxypentane-2,3-dione isomerase
MFVSCIHIHVKPEFLDKFIEISRNNHLGSRKEPGNLRFDILQQAEDPCRFMFYEVWASEDALEKHRDTTHYKLWKSGVENWMAEPRKGVRHHIIEPSSPSNW